VKDTAIVAVMIVAFAFVVTMHVLITYGLARRRPRWRAFVGFVFPPALPYWGWKERMRTRVALWVAFLLVYVVTLALASRGT
jgi:hypothetical protein